MIFEDIFDSLKFSNQEEFLTKIAEWLSQDLPSSLNGYNFLPTDGPVCREKFIENEQQVKDLEPDAEELAQFYETILSKMNDFGI